MYLLLVLSSLELKNFKCFQKHIVRFNNTSFLVGANNAGKSTIIEALRLIGILQSRFKYLNYEYPPSELDKVTQGLKCVKFSLDNLEIPSKALFYRYKSSPTNPVEIIGNFDNGTKLKIFLVEKHEVLSAYGIPYANGNNPIQNKREAFQSKIPSIAVLPQLTQLAINEKDLKGRTIRKALETNLSSSHFRNEVAYFHDYFDEFKKLAESTWEGLSLKSLEYHEEKYNFWIRDNNFVAEVAWMGSGLKMWLQIMWFLTKAKDMDILVLDEPDVYMHPDLQRKLAKLARLFKAQTILTTHSAELIAEVPPEEVVIVNKNRKESLPAPTLKAVQAVLNNMSSVHNLQLFRLWESRRFLIVEGKDLAYLSRIHEILYPDSKLILNTLPHMETRGFDNWERVEGGRAVFKNGLDEDVTIYCMFDRDYRPDSKLRERVNKALDLGMQPHIWVRKEIENYLISPKVITRIINKQKKQKDSALSVEHVEVEMSQIAENNREVAIGQIMDRLREVERDKEPSTLYDMAKKQLDSSWSSLEEKIQVIPGKLFLTAIARWAQDIYKVSLSPELLIRNFEKNDFCSEMKEVMTSIERLKDFPEQVW